jgi:hypothetical protein
MIKGANRETGNFPGRNRGDALQFAIAFLSIESPFDQRLHQTKSRGCWDVNVSGVFGWRDSNFRPELLAKLVTWMVRSWRIVGSGGGRDLDSVA